LLISLKKKHEKSDFYRDETCRFMKENGEKKPEFIRLNFKKVPSLMSESLDTIALWVEKLPFPRELKNKLLSIARTSKEGKE